MAADQPISPAVNDSMNKMDQRYAQARQGVIEEMTRPSPDEAVRLVRWIIENGIDPDIVFSDRRYADWMSRPEGILGVINVVRNAVRSKSICYPVTAEGPYVSFIYRHSMEFERMLMEEIYRHGPGPDVVYTHHVVGFAKTIDDFMELYEAGEKGCKATIRRILGSD